MTQRELNTVAETTAFLNQAASRMTEEEKVEVINFLAANPKAGVVMKETGGIRKVRFATEHKGKSGSVRIVYYFHSERLPLYLLAVFAKNEKDNLTKDQRNKLRKLVKEIRKAYGV